MATLHELDTVYSIEDCHLMIEIAQVDAHNRREYDRVMALKGGR